MAELIWDGKYDEHGNKRAPVRIELPFQTVETVNESVQERQRTLELSSSGHDPEWRNRLVWGDNWLPVPQGCVHQSVGVGWWWIPATVPQASCDIHCCSELRFP